jgi:hypothetical protein
MFKEIFPKTTERVPLHTPETYNRRIRQETEENVVEYGGKNDAELTRRIEDLDREWDIERVLEANASVVILLMIALGALVHTGWLILAALAAAFLFFHAVHGWCPPLRLFRRFGVRTAEEIHEERTALRVLRGDFDDTEKRPEHLLDRLRAASALHSGKGEKEVA